MSKQIIDHGFGIIETRETFYTEETMSKLNQQIAELQKQLKETKVDLSLARNEIDTLKGNLTILNEHKKIIEEQYLEKCKELKSQPAETVENIKKKIEKEKDKNDLAWLGFNKLDRILDEILKEYQKGEN